MDGASYSELQQRIKELERQLQELRAKPAESDFLKEQYGTSLAESDEKFRSLFNGINQAVFVHPLTHRGFRNFIEVNDFACECYGYSRDEFLKISPADISSRADVQKKGSAEGRRELTDSRHQIFEATHITRDGKEFPVEISSNMFTWQGQQVILSVAKDITERKRAEHSLQESEERFRSYIENSPNGVYIIDGTGRYVEVNQAACDMTDYTREELLQMTLLDLISESDREMVQQQFEQVKQTGKASGVLSYPREDGSWSFWNVSAVQISQDRYLGLVSDISRVKRAEKASVEKEKFISSLLRAIPTPVFFKDREGLYQGCNEAYSQFMGVTSDQVVGKKVYELFPEQFTEELHRKDLDLMDNPRHMVYEYILKNQDGEPRCVVTTLDVVRNESGEVTGMIGAFLDITDTKITKAELQEEKRKLESIFKASPTGIGLTVNRVFQEVNDKICRMTGYSREELLGKNSRMLYFTDEDYEYVGDEKYRQIRKSGTGAVEIPWRKKNGEAIHVFLSSTPLNIEDHLEGVTFTALDITESKLAREALSRNEQHLRLLINNSIDVIWQLDLDLKFTYVNPVIYHMTGYTQDEWVGSNLSEHFSPEEYENLAGKAAEIVADYKNFTYLIIESRLLKKNGCDFPVEITAKLVLNSEGLPVGLQGSTRDITQRKQTEDALRDSDAYLTYLFMNVPAGIMVVDSNTRKIIDVNSYTCDLIGLPREDIVHRICTDFICAAPDHKCPILDLGESVNNSERLLRNAEGKLIPIVKTVMSATLKSKDYLIEIFTDISERKRAETEKVKLQYQLQQSQKMESIGTMAGGIAHDFNNLLTVINGYSEMALDGMDKDNPLYDKLEQILLAGNSAGNLTSQLLAFSRKQLYKPELVEINSVITNMDKMIRRLIGEDINITTILRDGIPRINADRSQLDQVLVNLVVNARDAVYSVSEENTHKEITIETGEVVLDEEFVRINPDSSLGRHVFVAVSDNGIGITEENMQRIFEPFFTTKEDYKGTGLGLSTVYGIVKQNEGSITVTSEPGRGSTFKIYWPVIPDDFVVSSKARTDFSTAFGDETILIVEDNEAVCRFAYEALVNLGYNVSTASNGREALNRLQSEHFTCDLIITDLIMPEINGKEFAEKALLILPEAKVIYMSGYTGGQIVQGGLLEKDINFIQKPYSIDALAEKVRLVLDS